MKILNKVTKEGSKYAWQFPYKGESCVINHELASALTAMGFIKGNLLVVDFTSEDIEQRQNPETKASVGYRLTGFSSTLANDLIKINAERDAKLASIEQETKLTDAKLAAMRNI